MLKPTLLKLLLFTFLPSLLPTTFAFPAAVDPTPPSRRSRRVVVGTESSGSDTTPVVIWHGLGDEYDAPGLKSLGEEIRGRYPGKEVYFVRMDNDSSKDRYVRPTRPTSSCHTQREREGEDGTSV